MPVEIEAASRLAGRGEGKAAALAGVVPVAIGRHGGEPIEGAAQHDHHHAILRRRAGERHPDAGHHHEPGRSQD